MANQAPFENSQFVVSYELLQLLQWLIDHEPDAMKNIITVALNNGLDEQISSSISQQQQSNEELQQSVVDFFALLETLMHEALFEEDRNINQQRSILPEIDHIDIQACDKNTVAMSAAKASAIIENNNQVNAKDILCRELLKHWKPYKKRQNH